VGKASGTAIVKFISVVRTVALLTPMADRTDLVRFGGIFPIEDTIELFVEAKSADELDGPDNIVVAPHGDLIICEDGNDEQFVVGVTPTGNCIVWQKMLSTIGSLREPASRRMVELCSLISKPQASRLPFGVLGILNEEHNITAL
jgi:hypothetical protein